MKISHITVDFWNTLFKSNPDYAKERDIQVFNDFEKRGAFKGFTDMSVEQLGETYNNTKIFANDLELNTGVSLPVVHKHILFADRLGIPITFIDKNYFDLIDELFFQFPLIPVYDDMLIVLQNLSANYKVSILTNTGMIPTAKISKMLRLQTVVDSIHSSDANRYCKPHRQFYSHYLTKECVHATDWLHIGDDPVRDIEPVRALGGKAYLIKETSDWKNLINILL